MAGNCAALDIYYKAFSDDSSPSGTDIGLTRLNKSGGYNRLPAPLMAIAGPLIGLAYITFFPVIMVCVLGILAFNLIVRKR